MAEILRRSKQLWTKEYHGQGSVGRGCSAMPGVIGLRDARNDEVSEGGEVGRTLLGNSSFLSTS